MKDEIIRMLQIIQIILLCVISFMFLETSNERQKNAIELTMELQQELIEVKTEMTKMQNELKHNDTIVLKVLEKEW